jgi:hypothetical protein
VTAVVVSAAAPAAALSSALLPSSTMKGAVLAVAVAACAVAPASSPVPAGAPARTAPTRSSSAKVAPPPSAVAPVVAGPALYALDEALADVAASPLVFMGKYGIPGLHRIMGCTYKNDRVFVVDLYCTDKEMTTFSVAIISPTRGRVTFYAEADQPISKLRARADYVDAFRADIKPPDPRISLAPRAAVRGRRVVTSRPGQLHDRRDRDGMLRAARAAVA